MMWIWFALALASDVVLTARPAKEVFWLGEPVVVELTVENRGSKPVEIVQSDDGWVYRPAFEVAVVGPDGPIQDRKYRNDSGIAGSGPPTWTTRVAPGARESVEVHVDRWAWMDRPGSYAVDVGLGGTTSPRIQGTVQTRISLREGTREELAAYLDELGPCPVAPERGPAPALTALGQVSSLGFLLDGLGETRGPVCEARPGGLRNLRAFRALANSPTPEATRALFLATLLNDRALAHAAAEALWWRIPRPELEGSEDPRDRARTCLARSAWTGEVIAMLREYVALVGVSDREEDWAFREVAQWAEAQSR